MQLLRVPMTHTFMNNRSDALYINTLLNQVPVMCGRDIYKRIINIFMNEQKGTERIAFATISNADTPSNKEMDRHLEMVKEDVQRITAIKPVHKIPVQNGYVMTTRPEMWENKDKTEV